MSKRHDYTYIPIISPVLTWIFTKLFKATDWTNDDGDFGKGVGK
jgi:hypothetical protein